MRVNGLQILNYKSFDDSGWIAFSPGFNVVVGRNSSGKTALLDAFRFARNAPRQHLSLSRRRDAAGPPQSVFQVEFGFDKDELLDALLRGDPVQFPVPVLLNADHARSTAQGMVANFFEQPQQILKLRGVAGSNPLFLAMQYPSHNLFTYQGGERRHVTIQPNADRQSYTISNIAGGNGDTVPNLAIDLVPRKLYVFRAERLNIGEIGFQEERVLADNAANLPRVLLSLSTNPALFDRYNRHVNEIFPYIKRVVVFPKGTNADVRLWWVDLSTEREDLAIPLQESGTGVGQALAILYVAMTIQRGTIVIDEPNSFLHPGAARKLIEILRQYDNQYIVSTHSPEIIAAADPDALFVARWDEGRTRIERIEKVGISEQRDVLAEVGVSAADVFGADQIVWVEGQTEEECFPLILQRVSGSIPVGLEFLAVRSVDEIVRRQGTDQVVMEIYGKLTRAGAFLPEALRFSFDREKRSPDYIAKVEADTKGRVRFLPARCYESFLLHPAALANSLSSEAVALGGVSVSIEDVERWINANALQYDGKSKWTGALSDREWRYSTDAVKLLHDLYAHFVRVEYSKTKHSRGLTQWLLDNDPEFLRPLSDHVSSLVAK